MELAINDALTKGINAQKNGEMVDALRFYEKVLILQPNHSTANHNAGVVCMDIGQGEAALPFLRNALEVNPSVEQYWISYADALVKQGFIEDAEIVLKHAKKSGARDEYLTSLSSAISRLTFNDEIFSPN